MTVEELTDLLSDFIHDGYGDMDISFSFKDRESGDKINKYVKDVVIEHEFQLLTFK